MHSAPHPRLTECEGREGRDSGEGGTWVERPLLDPPQQLSSEQSGKEEFKLHLLQTNHLARRKNPTSVQRTHIASCSLGLVLFNS